MRPAKADAAAGDGIKHILKTFFILIYCIQEVNRRNTIRSIENLPEKMYLGMQLDRRFAFTEPS
jgi:hypothetical protein